MCVRDVQSASHNDKDNDYGLDNISWMEKGTLIVWWVLILQFDLAKIKYT